MIAEELSRKIPELRRLLHGAIYPSPLEGYSDDGSEGKDVPYAWAGSDTRSVALRQIKIRRGQHSFREKLLNRYGARCIMSGCQLPDVIQAAHIDPYRGEQTNHPGNGLLLRSDLHDLYDLDLLGIQPESLTVHVHPAAMRDGYEHFEGLQLRFTAGGLPSRAALTRRWADFLKRLEER